MAKRTAAVTVPLFPAEKKAVQEAADEVGVSPTEFVRTWAHEGSRLRRLPYATIDRRQPKALTMSAASEQYLGDGGEV